MVAMSIVAYVPSHVTFTTLPPRAPLTLHPGGCRYSRVVSYTRRLEARVLSPERQLHVVEERETDSPAGSAAASQKKKKKRKPRPNFCEQALRRWSVKIPSQRTKFPWEEEEKVEEKLKEEEYEERSMHHSNSDASHAAGPVLLDSGNAFDGSSRPANQATLAPWIAGAKYKKTQLRSGTGPRVSKISFDFEERNRKATSSSNNNNKKLEASFPDLKAAHSSSDKAVPTNKADGIALKDYPNPLQARQTESMGRNKVFIRETATQSSIVNRRVEEVKPAVPSESESQESLFVRIVSESDASSVNNISANSSISQISLPWKSQVNPGPIKQIERRNTEKAERSIPEPELRRLRNDALHMKEITKVGAAGVTEALVESIREKWKDAEMVKLRFEGPPAINMKRTHEILEGKTGGLVIWRSSSLVVLYRGMSYNLPCVQRYSGKLGKENNLVDSSKNSKTTGDAGADHLPKRGKKSMIKSSGGASFEQASHNLDLSDIDRLLDGLGPRFRDWSGREPLPVDADLLPQVIPGYKPPLRHLPYKVKHGLRDAEMTYLRQLARALPPHFALGRNRNHQGLAQAMVKLWEKSLIAKIAIKRGVLNTCNDRMAEEIKRLTGGVLLSRNKEFIIFYRGNDFLTPSIAEALKEREKFTDIRQDEEDQARQRASEVMLTRASTSKGRLIAGTLAETAEAKSHWANELSEEEIQKLINDAAIAKHASLIRFMERRLILAEEKIKKAEKALAKVQEFLEPSDLPSDLETVTDEERSLFRKMGLKMSAYLSLGRRGVYDGTVENMHLHWKHRELVKIIVKGKSFPQVKHTAVSLEAESGGVLISLDKTTKGYAIVVYRGKNYQRPSTLRPKNLLTKKQALARSIELQRREALKYHVINLRDKIYTMKSELEQMKKKESSNEAFNVDDAFSFDDVEEEGEEAYLQTYNSDNEDSSQ